jgi:hypothetical protein
VTSDEADRGLHDRFQALRREAARGTPSFHAMLAPRVAPRPQPTWRRWLVVGALAAVAATVVLTLGRPRPHRATLVDRAAVRWEAPTDFLLRAPGAELLRTIPTFTLNGRLLP